MDSHCSDGHKEWVITDIAAGSQLGTEQRIREKEAILTSAGMYISPVIVKCEVTMHVHCTLNYINYPLSGLIGL